MTRSDSPHHNAVITPPKLVSCMMDGGVHQKEEQQCAQKRKGRSLSDGLVNLAKHCGANTFRRRWLRQPLEELFILEEVLSKTLYGCIYKAVYKASGQKVAIKKSSKRMIHPTSARVFDDIESELKMHAKIQAKCTNYAVQIFEVLEDEEFLYVVMELAADGDLFNYVKKKQLLHEVEVRDIFQQIVSSVKCLHQNGVAHLDLSLENVVICDGSFKLCDFGVAQAIDIDGELVLQKHSNFRPGKARYMSPEVVQGLFNGASADLFSLGVILFCLLYGFHPFESPAEFDPAYVALCTNDFDALLDMYHIRGEVSWEAEDLMSELLCQADVRLPSCQATLEHNWMTGKTS